jgi:hypothetical protein
MLAEKLQRNRFISNENYTSAFFVVQGGMNKPKSSVKDYIELLIASPRSFFSTQAARV